MHKYIPSDTMCEHEVGDYKCEAPTSPPTYFPQPNDQDIDIVGKEEDHMGPVGPWASGKVHWRPLAGLTGTRPVVDHYSTTRFSMPEWRQHNQEVMCCSDKDLHRFNMAEFNSKRRLASIAATTDETQNINTLHLGQRAHEILKWKTDVERAIGIFADEIKFLENKIKQGRQAYGVLRLVKNVSTECLKLRAMRDGHDLTRDPIEEELIKEASLINEVQELIQRTIRQMQEQQSRNIAMKENLEADWSDKEEAYRLEAQNTNFRTGSRIVQFNHAATRFPNNQSTPEGWENATQELLNLADAVKSQSFQLRELLDGPVLRDCVKDLKEQAEKVDGALARGVVDLQLCIKAMETELGVVVRRSTDSEQLIKDLQNGIRAMDQPMKVAQSRLELLQLRPGYENTRDRAQFGLVDEVKIIAEKINILRDDLYEAQEAWLNLKKSRGKLEKELQTKLTSLYIDMNRCQAVRANYPSATAMCGF